MTVALPIPINQAAHIGQSYYENQRGGTRAVVSVDNTSAHVFHIVLTLVDQPVVSYEVASLNGLTLQVNGLLVAGILASAACAATGSVCITFTEF